MSYRTLDLNEIAEEWQDALDVLADAGATRAEKDEALDTDDRIKDFANDLGLSLPTPGDLEGFEGGPLVEENDFEEYTEEYAQEVGLVPNDLAWPMYYIDWERAANDLRMDYSSATYNGTDYLYRAY